ncbi:uncharacterized protein MONBRDRAFT_20622, partial [Monosiga brevicollis MX1]
MPESSHVPLVGFGTFNEFRDNDKVAAAVKHAIKVGYRHFDCAKLYGNELEIGKAINECIDEGLVKREELFIVTKLWNDDHRPDRVRESCAGSLKRLGLDYLDCFMIHWPSPWVPGAALADAEHGGTHNYKPDSTVTMRDTWTALEGLVEEGKIKSIGVSNFCIRLLKDLLSYCKIRPIANEVELHPYHSNYNLVRFCQEHDIHVTAYSPLGKIGYRQPGDPSLIEDPVLQEIGAKHNKSAAQVALRWNVQRGVGVIPKSLTPSRIEQNFDIDFELSDEEMKRIDGLNKNHRFV